MIDHATFPVSDVARTAKLWTAALKPLGYGVVMELTRAQLPQLPYDHFVGIGAHQKPDVWLRPARGKVDPTHLAISAPDRPSVDACYAAAIAAGFTDDGKPGPRAHYHPTYYGAFVKDPDGHSLEIVCHKPPA